jgi:hypothetical protein
VTSAGSSIQPAGISLVAINSQTVFQHRLFGAAANLTARPFPHGVLLGLLLATAFHCWHDCFGNQECLALNTLFPASTFQL